MGVRKDVGEKGLFLGFILEEGRGGFFGWEDGKVGECNLRTYHDLLFRLVKVLCFDSVGLHADDGDEEEAASF